MKRIHPFRLYEKVAVSVLLAVGLAFAGDDNVTVPSAFTAEAPGTASTFYVATVPPCPHGVCPYCGANYNECTGEAHFISFQAADKRRWKTCVAEIARALSRTTSGEWIVEDKP